MKTEQPPWWAAEDQADLDRVLWEFVECVHTHRVCVGCRNAEGSWCPPLNETWAAIEHWLYGRRLAAKAEWLRRRALEQILAELRGGREEAA